MLTAEAPQPVPAERPRNPRGRPKLAPFTYEVSVLLPVRLYDLCCREALARDVPVSVVFREAIIASRHRRGERV